MNTRFTIDGDDFLEKQLTKVCREVSAGVQQVVHAPALEALVLGGGYGRGQGGVLRTDEGDRPYNDMEFYVFVRGQVFLAERRYRAALCELGKRLSPGAGLHVEFKIYSLSKLCRDKVTMYTYDLVSGHKILFGAANIFHGCEHHLAAHNIPGGEATRLLFNRCSGLLLARGLLRQQSLTQEEKDFVGRNLAKAQLGFGDAVLTLFGQYHRDCRERHERLQKLNLPSLPPWIADLRRHHAEGVEFKLHPWRSMLSKNELDLRFAELHSLGRRIWLWAESRRLNHTFRSAREYAFSRVSKCPETPAWRNALLELKTFRFRALTGGGFFRYPRERLFDALCLLLWDEESSNEPAMLKQVQNHLRARTARWQDLMLAYHGLWQNYG